MSFDADEPDEQKKGSGEMDRSQGAARAISVNIFIYFSNVSNRPDRPSLIPA